MSEELKCARKGCGLEELHAVHDYAHRRGYHAFVAPPVAPAEPRCRTCGNPNPLSPQCDYCSTLCFNVACDVIEAARALQETTTPSYLTPEQRTVWEAKLLEGSVELIAVTDLAELRATLATQARTLEKSEHEKGRIFLTAKALESRLDALREAATAVSNAAKPVHLWHGNNEVLQAKAESFWKAMEALRAALTEAK